MPKYFDKSGNEIALDSLQIGAEASDMELLEYMNEFGFTSDEGKLNGSTETTPPTEPEKKTAAGDSSLADTSLESPEPTPIDKALSRLSEISISDEFESISANIDEPERVPMMQELPSGIMAPTGEFFERYAYDSYIEQAEAKLGKEATPEKVTEQAKAMYLNAAKSDLINAKAEEILEDFDNEIYTPLGRLNKYRTQLLYGTDLSEGGRQRKLLEKEVEASKTRAFAEIDRLSNNKAAQETYLETAAAELNTIGAKYKKNPKSVTPEEIKKYKNIEQSYNNVYATYKETNEELANTAETAGTLEELVDLTARSYDNLDIIGGRVASASLNFAGNFLNFAKELSPEMIQARVTGENTNGYVPMYAPGIIGNVGLLSVASDELVDKANEITGKIEKRQELSKMKSVEDFLEFGLDLFSEQAVNTALTAGVPVAGLGLVAASASGEKFRSMDIEMEDGEKYSPFQFYTAGLLYGAGEYVTEKIALDQFLTAKKALKKSFDLSGTAITQSPTTTISALKTWGTGLNQEGVAELGSQVISNFADKVVLDKGVSLWDGVGEAYFSGAVMSGLGFGAPGLISGVYSAATTGNEAAAAGKRSQRVIEITNRINDLQANSDLSDATTQEAVNLLQEEADGLLKENLKSMKAAEARIDELSRSDKRILLNIDSQIWRAKGAADKINSNENLTEAEKKSLILKHSETISKLESRKDDVLANSEASKSRAKARVFQMKTAAEKGLDFNYISGENTEDAVNQAIEAVDNANISDEDKESIKKEIQKAVEGEKRGEVEINGFYYGAKEGFPMAITTKQGEQRERSVTAHEVSHATLFRKLVEGNADMIGLAQDLRKYMEKTYGEIAVNKFAKVDKSYGTIETVRGQNQAEVAEELMAAAIELSRRFDLKTSANKTLQGKLLGRWNNMFKVESIPTEIKTGKDVLAAIESFNASFDKGEVTGLAKKIFKGEVKAKQAEAPQEERAGAALSKTLTPEQDASVIDMLAKRAARIEEAKKVAEKFGVEVQADAVQQRLEAKIREQLSPLIGKIVTNRTKALYDPIAPEQRNNVSRDDFQNSLRTEIEALAFEEFKEGKQDIEKFLVNRAFLRSNNLASRLGIESAATGGIKKDIDTAKGMAVQEDVVVEAEKPTYKSLLQRRVVEPEVLETAKKKVLSAVRVLKQRLDAEVSKNVTVTPVIAEIKKVLGKQLDIDLKKAMGGKKDGELRKFLLRNKSAILENMTTTYLMTAMPNAVQKQVDGVWTSDWKGKKIDREKVTTNNAGRTSGAELVRRLPKAGTRMPDAEFLSNILQEDGNPIRGRKESLAKAIAEELAFDIIKEELQNPESEIGKAFFANQERLGVEVSETTVVEFNRQAERGNVKFSKGTREITEGFNPNLDLELEGANKTNSWLKRNGKALPPDLRTEEGQDAYIAEMKSTLLPLMPKAFWFGDKGGSVFTGTVKGLGSGLSSSDPLWKRWQEKMGEIFADADQVYGEDLPGIADFKVSSYTTIFKNPQTILQNISNGSIEEFNKKVAGIHAAMWARFSDIIAQNPDSVTVIARYLNLSSSNTQHPQRMGAQFVGFSEGFASVKDVTFEHAMPNISSYIYLLDAALNSSDFNAAYNAVISNYKLLALAKESDEKLVGRYKTNMPIGWNLITDNWYNRYFNPEIAENNGGIDPNSIITLNGQKFGDRFGIRNDGSVRTEAGIKFSKSVNEKALADAKANIKRLDEKGEPRKARVFDFDDTLARSNSNVLYTMPDGKTGKLNATEFAKRSEELEAAGAVFDFSEFSKVVDGKKGPLFELAKFINESPGKRDMFVLTARPQDAALPIHKFLKALGLNIPLENITGLANGAPKAKADWMLEKFEQGYNDFYFADDALKNVKAVKEALKTIDAKSKVQLAKFSKVAKDELSDEFNNILERKTGVESFKTFSKVQAQMRGANKGRFKFFVAPNVEDFRGLVNYAFAGKGKQGEADMKWLEEKLMTPYAKGVAAIDGIRQQIKRDFKQAVKAFPQQYRLLNKEINKSGFTYDQALRVYLWKKAGINVPGLSQKDAKLLDDAIKAFPELVEFGEAMLVVARRDQWMEPGDYWQAGTLLSDLNSMTEKVGRKKYLEEFIENADVIFSEDNLNKIEALYGKPHRDAIEDALYSMKNGTNRNAGGNKQVNAWLNWINGSTGAIMFFNRRSALLQMLSFTNFINWSDNNILKAGAAFANQKQYWTDWVMIFNSDKLKERRGGLKQDVSSDEIASLANKSKNSPQAILAYLLQIGFTPTQVADSMAIATGGATFYRNRVNKYVKEGQSQKQAEEQAFIDFAKKSDEAQQSSDPSMVSQVQRSTLGRLVFAFQNTPLQYTRLMKKAALDLANGRGDWKENVSKIAYYGAIQNFIFSALQSALFAMLPGFDDDEDETLSDAELEKKNAKEEQKIARVLNSMLDTLLKGSGVYGAVFSTVKNLIKEYEKQEEKGFMADHTYTILAALGISPPIGSKARKLYSAIQTKKFDRDEIEARGWAVTADGKLNLGPNWSILGNVLSASVNLPLDRVVDELTSVAEAFDTRNKMWQRIALGLGWKTWDVGVKDEEGEAIKEAAKAKRKAAGVEKAKETRKKSRGTREEREARAASRRK